MAKKGTPEGHVLNSLCDYLARRKYFFWRSNNTGTAAWGKDGKLFFRNTPKYAMKGVPDIILIDDTGHFIGIEAKAPKGKQSPDQKLFQENCKKTGGEYILARSIDDLVEHGL